MNLETFIALLIEFRNKNADIKIQIDIPDLFIDDANVHFWREIPDEGNNLSNEILHLEVFKND